jgi:hypothetical protein
MNKAGLLAIGLGAFFSPLAISQEASDTVTWSDPAQSRLFLMPTGRLLAEQTFSVGTHDVALFTAGYAPTDYLALNGSFMPVSIDGKTNPLPFYSFGAKIGIIGPHGFMQGVAIGGDVFCHSEDGVEYDEENDSFRSTTIRRTVYMMNASVSLGSSDFAVHFGLAQFLEKGKEYSSADAQIGTEWLIYQGQNGHGVKLMAESHLGMLPDGSYYTGVLMVGARFIGPRAATELTWPLVSEGDGLEAWTFPYVAFLFYF